MGRFLAGVGAAMLLMTAALFWWQSAATGESDPVPVAPAAAPSVEELTAARPSGIGPAPPEAPEATPASLEERRFGRYDKNEDGQVSRREMMSTRTSSFRSLDTDRDNFLTFEEWAVATGERFAGADADGSGTLTAAEFATTRRQSSPRPACHC